MRIARIITRLNIGGPAIHAVNLSSGLTTRGFDTLLVYGSVGAGEGNMAYLLDRANPRPRTLLVTPLRRPLAPSADLRAWWIVYRALCAFRPHIVHTHTAKAGAIGRLAAVAYNRTAGRRAPARIVHTYHGHVLDGYFSRPATTAFIGIERRLALVTDRLIAVSPSVRDGLADRHGIGRLEQFQVVPLGFDLERFASIDDEARRRARGALQIAPGDGVVTTVGRLTAIKDHALFLDTAQRIVSERPATVFLIAGDGELRPALEARASALGVTDRVRFLGWRLDLELLYGATDVLLLTSRNEGTPVALIEGLTAGCSAVSTDVGGVRDVICTSEVGLLAPAGDAGRLAEHVRSLLDDPRRRRAMGDAGRRLMLARYGLDRLLTDIDKLYRNLFR